MISQNRLNDNFNPKVSVVLACYNGAKWLKQAIESVLDQTYPNLELVIIDDGSTDKSKEIVSSYKDPRICYQHQENQGFSAAINRGIIESTGELIGFIGQDDVWLLNKLELQTEFLKNYDVDLICSNYYYINSAGKIIGGSKAKLPNFSSKQEVVKRLFIGNFIGFETVLLKRKCFDNVGLFDERMVAFSDHDMWLRVAGTSNIWYLSAYLVKKREHELRLSLVKSETTLMDEFLITKNAVELYPFLEKLKRKKFANLFMMRGVGLLLRGNNKDARKDLIKAIMFEPWNLKAIAVLIVPHAYTFLRKGKLVEKVRID